MSDLLLTETPADPHHDPRPWQKCIRKNIRKGDLVETRIGDRLRWGVAHRQDANGDWLTKRGYPITYGDLWPLRRNPAPTDTPTISEENTTMTTTPADPRRWRECRFDDIEKGDRVRWAFTEDEHGTFEMVEGVAYEMRKRKGNREWVDAGGTGVAAAPAHGTDGFRYWRLAGHESAAPTPPAEEVELPTEHPAHITDVEHFGGDVCAYMALDNAGDWCGVTTQGRFRDWSPQDLAAFTLPDSTRVRRDGKHEDGTPRFVKVKEGK